MILSILNEIAARVKWVRSNSQRNNGIRDNGILTYPWATDPLTHRSVAGIIWYTWSLFPSLLMSSVPESAVCVRPTNRDKKKNEPKKEPRFHVILWNDDDHTYEYVIIMLHTLFGYSVEKGFQLAREVDTRGKAIIFTSSLEQAEIKRDQILGFGPDPLLSRSKGSIIATLEKAAED